MKDHNGAGQTMGLNHHLRSKSSAREVAIVPRVASLTARGLNAATIT